MRVIITLLIILSCVNLIGQDCAPVSHYRFENNWNDTRGNNNLIPKNGIGFNSTYIIEGSYSMNPNALYERAITSKPVNQSQPWSIIGHARIPNTITAVFWESRNTSNRKGFGLELDATNKRFNFVADNGASQSSAFTANNTVPNEGPGVWFAVVDYNPSDEYISLYVNGVRSGTDSIAIAGASVIDTISFGATRSGAYRINGILDNVQIYNRALSVSEVLDMYNHRTENYYPTCEASAVQEIMHPPIAYHISRGEKIIPKVDEEDPEDPEDPPIPTDFNIYVKYDFEAAPLGTFNTSYFGQIYKQYGLPNLSIVNKTKEGTSSKVLRMKVNAPTDPIRYSITVMPYIGSYDEVYISYRWQFDPNTPSTLGGKLSGAGGIPNPESSDPENPASSWMHRNMFKQAGRIVHYYYSAMHYQLSTNTYPPYGTNTVHMVPGMWYEITQRFVMNTSPSLSNGIYECWVDGVRVITKTGFKYYQVARNGNVDKIRVANIAHFYGGSGDAWWPDFETAGYMDDFTVWTPKTPVVTGSSLHPSGYVLPSPVALGTRNFIYDQLRTTPGMISNSQYGTNYTKCKDETWLVDAGIGNTVTFNYSYGLSADAFGMGDFLLIYNGRTTDSPLLKQHYGTGSSSATSTGRYMYIRFVTDETNHNIGFSGSLTFN